MESAEGRLDEALLRLQAVVARVGSTAEVTAEARRIAAGWWLDVQAGATPPERLHIMIGELRRWCLVASDAEIDGYEALERAGNGVGAERSWQRAQGMRLAAEELSLYEGRGTGQGRNPSA